MTASDKRERRSHFRGKPRPGRRVEVEYQAAAAASETRRAFTRNIGVGGAFIVTDEPERPGTQFDLMLRVPTSTDPVRVRAEVRWNHAGDAEFPRGMGVKFQGLDVEELIQ